MVKLYFIQSLIFAAFVYQLPFSAEAQTSPSDYFRSASSGFWNSTSSWESSPDGATNWIAATMGPTSTANTILIRNGHLITIATNTVADQVVVQSGGTLELGTAASTFLTINDGTGSDIIIESGGIFRHNIAAGSQLPSFTGTAVMEIRSGGVLEVENSNGFPSDYANSNSSISPNIIWSDGSVFNWNSLTSPADGITYFPSAADIPIFRVSKPITIGNTASTIINGLLEATATVSLSSTGAKTFRNGIIGNATVTATAINGGQILINGSAAKLGGGQLVLNNNGLAIASNTTVNMVSNKSINNFSGSTGTVTVSGTLTCDDYLIDGTSKIQVDGTLKTTNVNGLTGGSNTTFVTGFGVNTFGST